VLDTGSRYKTDLSVHRRKAALPFRFVEPQSAVKCNSAPVSTRVSWVVCRIAARGYRQRVMIISQSESANCAMRHRMGRRDPAKPDIENTSKKQSYSTIGAYRLSKFEIGSGVKQIILTRFE